MAVTMIALYKEPADREKFEKHYFGTHIPLVKKIPGLQKVEVSRFTGKDAPYYLMATLYFNSKEERKAGLSSPEGQATTADVPNFATPDIITIAFTELV
ncbi:EthD family reductase [Dictyobacter kobayashii]|uniref:Putative ethyl tert-butyl ether degradation protein EthD n=1 Tax=Dictyobacter kobayashii TaxID=2014872 RepID=A0A402AN60_9CHLR|nr:EthD family reductase [Dictyobacter kobayashii]GCE20522.1 putative ethyl tert-butyl ether degradation protein EthD [Dictyobacter kobayashii]